MRKPSVLSMSAMSTAASFSASVTEMKTVPSRGSRSPAASEALAKASGKARAHAHDLAGGLHLRTQGGVDPGEAREGQDGFLHGDVLQVAPAGHPAGAPRDSSQPGRPMSRSFWPAMTLVATRASETPVALLTNGTVRLPRGLTSST